MIDLRGRIEARHLADGVEKRGRFRFRRAQRNSLQVGEALNILLRILHGQHVIIPGLRVDPVTRGDHSIGSQCGNDIVYHLFLAQPEFTCPQAVNVKMERGVINVLRDIDFTHARRLANFTRQPSGHSIAGFQIRPAHLNINRCRQSLIQDRIYDAPGLEVGGQLGQVFLDLAVDGVHVFKTAHLMPLVQCHLDCRGVRPRIARIYRRKSRNYAHIGDDQMQVFGWHCLPDQILYAGDLLVGDLHPGP